MANATTRPEHDKQKRDTTPAPIAPQRDAQPGAGGSPGSEVSGVPAEAAAGPGGPQHPSHISGWVTTSIRKTVMATSVRSVRVHSWTSCAVRCACTAGLISPSSTP